MIAPVKQVQGATAMHAVAQAASAAGDAGADARYGSGPPQKPRMASDIVRRHADDAFRNALTQSARRVVNAT